MSDPSGGANTGPILEGIGAVLTAAAALGALIASLFRRPKSSDELDELKDAVDDMREQALESQSRDYRAEVRRVHQLEALCRRHGIRLPPRDDDD